MFCSGGLFGALLAGDMGKARVPELHLLRTRHARICLTRRVIDWITHGR
ncbi:Uncharacterised protein [Mycobacteroides abscessus subsp. abscessus]|nr:Uncharacterised protein [Mycobacteroides abscessus subsp. bolletii]SIH82128.1 Uncharacterised protein [Mycobacteroides abscessus subsp. abscessus]SHW70277.1 Uncharacterised protein [Mycobacteroides abscessus subsp. bolletii]SHX30024.1 Uncharacterised protein [Mycobacteroides abscessus subsp. bolletii]SHX67864.1 Uncharacterised protein [Mycobacteroides abscessus subsp. bolletii]